MTKNVPELEGNHRYYSSCIRCTGAVIDDDYRTYGNYCYFSSEGELIDPNNQYHPDFQFSLDEVIELEMEGSLGPKQTCKEYITQFTAEAAYFGCNNE